MQPTLRPISPDKDAPVPFAEMTPVTDRSLALFAWILTAAVVGSAVATSSHATTLTRRETVQDTCPCPSVRLSGVAGCRISAVDALAKTMVAGREVPGLSLGIVQNGKLIFSRGYGKSNLELGTDVVPDTVFNIYSITKTFTAVAILQMAERKQLDLNDRLSKFFPGFPGADKVSVRQMLSHTSGIHNYTDEDPVLEKMGATPDELVKMIAAQKTLYDFEPGSRWEYSSSNYVLLGRIIEKVSGQTFSKYMRSALFGPAGLSRTAADRNVDLVAGRAAGYVVQPNFPLGFGNPPYADLSVQFAAGNMRSTVPDLARWFNALFSGEVISRASLSLLSAPVRVNDGRLAGDALFDPDAEPIGQYGLGVRTYLQDGRRVIGPSGSFYAYSSKVAYFVDDKIIVIVLTNVGNKAADLEKRISTQLFINCPVT